MITAETVHNLILKKAFRGYDIQEVDNFLEQVEQQLAQDARDMEGLRGDLAKAAKERDGLQQQARVLAAEREDAAAARHELQEEIDRLNALLEQYGQDSTKAEEFMMDIYRMRKALISDANAQADETRAAAEAALAQAKGQAAQIVSEAQAYKAAVEGECAMLYRKASDFRAAVLEGYRRQMEAIQVFPEHGDRKSVV